MTRSLRLDRPAQNLDLGNTMSKAEIFAGICGFNTTVEAHADGDRRIPLHIDSDRRAVCKLAAECGTWTFCARSVGARGR